MHRIAFELGYLIGLARISWHSDRPSGILSQALDSGWLKSGDRILEVGCGLGSNTELLASRALDVTGIDLSAVAISKLRRELARKKLRANVYQADFLNGLDERPFDVVFARATLHSFPKGAERSAFASRMAALTRPGGTILLAEMRHIPELGERKSPPFGISAGDLHEMFGADFEISAVGEEFQIHRLLGALPFAHWRLVHAGASAHERDLALSSGRERAKEARGEVRNGN